MHIAGLNLDVFLGVVGGVDRGIGLVGLVRIFFGVFVAGAVDYVVCGVFLNGYVAVDVDFLHGVVHVEALVGADCAGFAGLCGVAFLQGECDDAVLAGLNVGEGHADFLVVALHLAGEVGDKGHRGVDILEVAGAGLVFAIFEAALVVGNNGYFCVVGHRFFELVVEFDAYSYVGKLAHYGLDFRNLVVFNLKRARAFVVATFPLGFLHLVGVGLYRIVAHGEGDDFGHRRICPVIGERALRVVDFDEERRCVVGRGTSFFCLDVFLSIDNLERHRFKAELAFLRGLGVPVVVGAGREAQGEGRGGEAGEYLGVHIIHFYIMSQAGGLCS